MSRILLALIVTVVAGVFDVMPAQAQAPDSTTIRAASSTMKSDLRNLVTAQESYFADNMTYAPSVQAITRYRASRGVTVVTLMSSNKNHSAIAIIETVPGLVCAIFVGDASPPLGTGEEGVPVCRGP